MKLKENLYTIEYAESGVEECRFLVRLLPESEIYKAHFPGMPVTPGVCVIQIVKELMSERLGSDLILTDVKNAKFLKVITPDIGKFLIRITKIARRDNMVTAMALFSDTDANTYAKISVQAIVA